ncbi:TPA: UTP--glucose-1-phosphate uridylyltransferase [Patescibacteria group bacterium]|nr:UTP--glucose-1-phosphate uridylyltransferase [Patescibacteria group bacterium]
MTQKITKGVIAIAGFGTRFLPATKATPKEMLPIIDKPIIQYIVEEMAAAGITDIILVTNWQKRSVEDHFDRSREIEKHLEEHHKTSLLREIRKIDQLANFVYVRQKQGYGNGAPLLAVQSLVKNEPFVYAFGDDVVKSKVPFCRQLINVYHQHQCSVIGAQEVPKSEIGKYGIAETDKNGYLKSILEKPTPQQTKSNLATFGRYLLTPDIFPALQQTPVGKGGEFWLTDALNLLLLKKPIIVHPVTDGKWYTTGDPINYLKTTLAYINDREDLRYELKNFMKNL